MKRFLISTLGLLTLVGNGFSADGQPTAETSLFRVNITSQGWNFIVPWQKTNPGTRRGLGALIEGNRVLVTAELAQDASYIELEQADTGRKITAKVESIDYECDLATLVPVEDAGDFFAGKKPLEIDTTSKPKDKFEVWQFENNGSAVTTPLEFTRADTGEYFLDGERFLIFEASGPVQYRAGTFTLPVVNGGKLAGMLLSYSAKDQVAQILPGTIIKHFIEDAKDGKYDGFPQFGIKMTATLDRQFRSYLKLDGQEGGVYLSEILPDSSAQQAGLKKGDVILEINGYKIDSRGNYVSPEYGLLSMGHLTKGGAKVGDTVKLKIFRDGAPMDIEMKLSRRDASKNLVDPHMFDRAPKFVILGGLLFQELTDAYLGEGERRERAPFMLTYAQANPEKFLAEGRKKLVFLSAILPAESNQGYERMNGLIVTKVNDQFITDIKALDEAIKKPINGIHKIEFQEFPKVIYIDDAQAKQDNEETMPRRYRITTLKRLE